MTIKINTHPSLSGVVVIQNEYGEVSHACSQCEGSGREWWPGMDDIDGKCYSCNGMGLPQYAVDALLRGDTGEVSS